MSLDVQVTVGLPQDAHGIQYVRCEGWVRTYPNPALRVTGAGIASLFEDDALLGLRNLQHRLAEPPEGHAFVVARHGRELVGFCEVCSNKHANQILELVVHPDWLGLGIGSALWREVHTEKYLDLTRDITAWVVAYNQAGISFLREFGFVRTSEAADTTRLRLPNRAVIPEVEMRRASRSAP